MQQLEYNFKRFEKGASLVEVMVAMFVFTIMISTMIGVFTTLLHKRTEVRKMQQQTEEFSLAMSYMAKKIRTSTYVSDCGSGADKCVIHENIQPVGTNTTFEFTSANKLTEEIGSGSATEMLSNVTGGFSVNTGSAKRITMHMMTPGKLETSVQTTVSLRSY